MATLTLDLQDGFFDDRLVVTADGREVLRLDGLRTRFQIGFARSETIALAGGRATLEIAVPSRSRTATIAVDSAQTPFLGVSITPEGEIVCHAQAEPFRYA